MTLSVAPRRFVSLSWFERRELALACALQLLLRASLRALPLRSVLRHATWPFAQARAGLTPAQIDRLARWSTRMCGGSCLTESLVTRILSWRHGLDVPVTIGVSRTDGVFRAHAWAGANHADSRFLPIWSEDRRSS